VNAPSASFCILPWVHLFADEQGIMRPCCMTLGDRKSAGRDADGQPFTVARANLDDAWNSPFMKELRRDMLAGRRPAVCVRCFDEEDLGMESHRQAVNETHRARIAEAVAATGEEGESPATLIRSVDLRLGNVCNLRCRMCSPLSSRLLIDEWREMFDLAADDPRLERLRRVDWFARDEFWSTFEKYVPEIEMLHFGGGEPLLVPQALDFLQRLIDRGVADRIKLSYITNLTVLPPRLAELWPKFRSVSLAVSIDGYAEVNNFIRYPTDWARLDANLRRLREHGAELNVRSVTFNTTVQLYNALRLTDLFAYTFSLAAPHVDPYPRLVLLSGPEPFSVGVLPENLRELAAARLRDFVARWEGHWPEPDDELPRFRDGIDGVIAHMQTSDMAGERPEFLRRNAVFDRARGQNVCDIVPELAPLFEVTA